jgi:hypothetical protein
MVRLRRTFEWIQAVTWGWVIQSGELTGTGIRHAGEIPTGILPPHQIGPGPRSNLQVDLQSRHSALSLDARSPIRFR